MQNTFLGKKSLSKYLDGSFFLVCIDKGINHLPQIIFWFL